jgi:protein O-GlcNAc transferase
MNSQTISSLHQLQRDAQNHKDAGRLDEALRCCDDILAAAPNDAAALHLKGAVLHLTGKSAEAIDHLRRAVAAEPTSARYLVTLGGNLAVSGRIEEAATYFERAIEADCESAEANLNLGFVRKHQKRYQEAATYFRKVLQLAPLHAGALANLAFCLVELGDAEKAFALALQSLDMSPGQTLALAVAAGAEAKLGNASEAALLTRLSNQSIDINTLSKLAQHYISIGKTGIAKAIYAQVNQRNPNDWESVSAVALLELGDLRVNDALTTARRAVSLAPNSPGALMTLGIVGFHAGAFREAKQALARSIEMRPLFGARLLHDLMLPPIMESHAKIKEARESFESALDRMRAERVHSDYPFLEMGYTYFYLAFHGENDRLLQEKIARFYLETAPSLRYVAPHTQNPAPPARPRRRIGFYSRFIYKHSVAVSFAKLIEAMTALDVFDIYLISDASPDAYDIKSVYPTLHERCVTVRRDLDAARESIAKLELDALIYLDIGMDPLSYQLAFARLAKTQAVMGGHPVTTGIPTVDFFFSAEGLEAPDAQEHYSEKLFLLKHGGFQFERPKFIATDKGRSLLGAAEGERVYFCPMMLQKLHPDFDEAMDAILRRDSSGVIVLVESGFSPEWTAALRERLKHAISPDCFERLRFIPWVSNGEDFFSAISAADVIIDSFNFGIGTTSVQVFAAGTPLITLPSAFSRGRVGMYFSKLIGVEDGIATSVEDYIDRAVRVAGDPTCRDLIKSKILANNHILFGNEAASVEFADALLQLTAA